MGSAFLPFRQQVSSGVPTTNKHMRNTTFLVFLVSIVLLGCFSSCQRSFGDDDDGEQQQGDAVWNVVDEEAIQTLKALYATPFELYAINESQFYRFGKDNQILEKRPLELLNGPIGTPAMHENWFVRLIQNQNSEQQIEFNLTRNSREQVAFTALDLLSSGDSFLEFDWQAREVGTFNRDGSQILVPTKVRPGNHYRFYLFDIRGNGTFDAFNSVLPVAQFDIPGMSATEFNLSSVYFHDGKFYIASKEGAWRIDPNNSSVTKIFNQWMIDFAFYETNLWATGFNTFDLHTTTDDGLTWERVGQQSQVRFMEPVADLLFSQPFAGNVFQLASSTVLKSSAIEFDDRAPLMNGDAFYGVAFFENRFYFTGGKKIYFTEEVVLK